MFRSSRGLPPWLRAMVARVLSWVPEALLFRVLPASAGVRGVDLPAAVVAPRTPRRVLIGPANSAGQAWQWMRAAERILPDVGAVSMTTVQDDVFGHPVDYAVPLGIYRWSRRWQREQRKAVESGFTHVIVESGKRLFGDVFPGSVVDEIATLDDAGIAVALLFHGSDIRLPSRHAASGEWSPFRNDLWSITPQLESVAAANSRLVDGFAGHVFVSTPDLLADVERGEWLPLVVDAGQWSTDQHPFDHPGRPRVAHAPSKAVVKGSDLIDPILSRLHSEGVLEYVRVEGVAAADMPDIYRKVDIVLDQFRIGSYGVAACEAMAAGRVVVSHVSNQVRDYVRAETGLDVPILQATAADLEVVLRGIIADPTAATAAAARGVDFVSAVHDGRRSAAVLQPFLASPVRGE